MTTSNKRLLVTSALPYANGAIHLGHLVEYIQTDVWVRYWKMTGRDVLYVCADDTHGTPIMLRAQQEGISPEKLIARISKEHQDDFSGFGVEFDNYGSTHSPENRKICNEIWASLIEAKLIKRKVVTQLFDPKENIFLADRFVRGRCPKCNAADQYGDNCEKCGATYSATDLIDPHSAISGAIPEVRQADHFFVELSQLHDFLQNWTQNEGHLRPEIARYIASNFLDDRLRDWDVSRPGPYFGFEIPDSPGHYWYVWFDAPVGYIASTLDWCNKHGQNFDNWWKSPECEVHHFIGKDITYFHTLFWPGMLKNSGFNLPEKVHIHGFLTINGEKMSKARGTFINAVDYLKKLDPQYLRYYYATKLGPTVEDIDLSTTDFVARVNSDLVNNIANIPSRTLKLLHKYFDGTLAEILDEDGDALVARLREASAQFREHYELLEFAKATRLAMALTTEINQYLQKHEPWNSVKDSPEAAQKSLTAALNAFRILTIYLNPILPEFGRKSAELFGESELLWNAIKRVVLAKQLGGYKRLIDRVDRDVVASLFQLGETEDEETLELPVFTTESLISISLEGVAPLEIETLENYPEYTTMSVDLSSSKDPKSIVVGADIEALETQRKFIVVSNLPTKNIKGHRSEAMLLGAKSPTVSFPEPNFSGVIE